MFHSISDGCYCNGHYHQGRGQCMEDPNPEIERWCYVDSNSKCNHIKNSTKGAPYQWSTDPCKRGEFIHQIQTQRCMAYSKHAMTSYKN